MLFAADALADARPVPRPHRARRARRRGGHDGSAPRTSSPAAAPTASTASICCEPEGGEICHVAKGALRLRLDFTGKMAHGAMPFQGRNPNRAVGAGDRRARRPGAARCRPRHGDAPAPRQVWITPTVLRAGEPAQMNVMPAGASVWVDVRTIPAVDHDELRRRGRPTLVADSAGDARRRRRRRR